jgi:hypothetical protein
MMQPLIMITIDVVMGAERPRVELLLGALIDEGALVAREGLPSFSASKKYWRSSGLICSRMKRMCAAIG